MMKTLCFITFTDIIMQAQNPMKELEENIQNHGIDSDEATQASLNVTPLSRAIYQTALAMHYESVGQGEDAVDAHINSTKTLLASDNALTVRYHEAIRGDYTNLTAEEKAFAIFLDLESM